MHILVITPGFPKDENDTGCIPPMQLFLDQIKNTYQDLKLSVISIHYPYDKSSYDWKGIKVFSCGGSNKKQPLRLLYWMKVIRHSLKINRELKVDIIHSYWLGEAALLGQIVRVLFKIKHVNTMMGQDVIKTNKYLKFLSLKKIHKIAVSKFQADHFKKSAGLEVNEIIPWGINNLISENQKRTFDIIGVGSLLPVKNFILFVQVIKKVKEDLPNLKCLIIGDGIERQNIEYQIKELGMKENICLKGQLSREEVLYYMKQSKMLLHTSNFESFGFVIVEALALGCYVVCKGVGCAVESNKLFLAQNAEEFSKNIKNILQNENDYTPEIPFPINNTVEAYYKLYKKLLINS